MSSPTAALDAELEKYPEDIKIIQQYVYLIDYYNRDLDATALNQLTTYFQYAKSKGVKFLLRFAYEYDSAVPYGPTTAQIISHIGNLKGWLENNTELFCDVVYSVQLGMIGLWGEGHSSYNKIEKSAAEIMTAMADFIPEPYTIMLRYYTFYAAIPDGLENRFGMNEDWLVGKDVDMYDFYRINYLEKETVTEWCKYTVNDAEMPWGRDETVKTFDAVKIINQLKAHSISTLSIAHNYIENEGYNPGDYFLHQCKSISLTDEVLKENGLPYRAELLTNGSISAFDYLKYHLGYLLSVDGLTSTGNNKSFKLTNYGFAAPVYYKLQVLDGNSNVLVESGLENLVSGATEEFRFNTSGDVYVKIVHKANESFTVKLANDLVYENGTTLLKNK